MRVSLSGGAIDVCRQISIKWCRGWSPANLMSTREDFPQPSATSFFAGGWGGVLGFFPFDTQIHMLISSVLMEMTINLYYWERKICHLLRFFKLV